MQRLDPSVPLASYGALTLLVHQIHTRAVPSNAGTRLQIGVE